MEAMNWTVETYRLDEVEKKFGLPCVIHLNEGYYSTTDAEGFSQGDVMSVDSKLVLHKIAANFATDVKKHSLESKDSDYVELAPVKEILIPLNYKGRLKVLQRKMKYENVKELARDFPRYARLRQNLSVLTEDNRKVTLYAGTVMELDRIIPGSTFGDNNSSPDRLIVQFEHLQRRATVALPVHLNGKFITEHDDNEYTLKEAIDRYSLPQYVQFVSDEIKKVYTSDLHDGISNMTCISDTSFRLNRLVTQEVLVGHYKPVTEYNDFEVSADGVKQRTLILLPTDNPDIKDIEVNVLKDFNDDVYEDIFMVRNVSRSKREVMDGALYIDFADCPGIRRFSSFSDQDDEKHPPPLPLQPPPARKQDGSSTLKHSRSLTTQKSAKPSVNLATLPRTKPRSYSDCSIKTPPILAMQFSQCMSELCLKHDSSDYVPMNCDNYVQMNPIRTYEEQIHVDDDKSPTYVNYDPADTGSVSPKNNTLKRSGLLSTPTLQRKSALPRNSKKLEKNKSSQKIYSPEDSVNQTKPTAKVQPQNVYAEPFCGAKLFYDLSTDELVERLRLGGLDELAELCFKEKLNGAFFHNINKERLKKVMGLKNLQLAKFLQMRDENWIPT
ncbi:hypothetical protein ACF0H5_005313 [Mactra antiquata]